MTKIVIVGSGPAAAAAAIALIEDRSMEVEVIDIGEQLETESAAVLADVSDSRPDEWPEEARRLLSRQPAPEAKGELPQKWLFGSDFPFRDRGQMLGVTAIRGGNTRTVSGAFGGLSNAWGAQIMPFSEQTFADWPVSYDALLPHYRAVLESVPLAGEDDDYKELFPLLVEPRPLPPLSPPATRVLERYGRSRYALRKLGVTVGAARLAIRAEECVECGLCLTGCPRHVIYSSAHTLAPLLMEGRISYRPGTLVLRVGEDEHGCWLEVRHPNSSELELLRADRILLAAGGLGSTRIVLNSIRRETTSLHLGEAVQIVLPFISGRGLPDPRTYETFTLNQFNMLLAYGRRGLDLAQMHFYPYNPTYEEALPGFVSAWPRMAAGVLKRTTAGLGYLPSWASPRVRLDVQRPVGPILPPLHLKSEPNSESRAALRKVAARLLAAAPLLDLWPMLPMIRLSGPAKSYHFGGSMPHRSGRPQAGKLETDLLGRPAEWTNIHLIDASVFPTIAATTFTLTVMANAHRIASSLIHGASF